MKLMPVTDKSWIIIIICAVASLLIILDSSVLEEIENPEPIVGKAIHPLYPTFSTPIASFNMSSVLSYSTIDTQKTLTFSVNDDAVYRTAYISINGTAWQPFNLTGATLNGNWLQGQTTGTYNIQKNKITNGNNNDNYIIIYTCTKNTITATWDCHNTKWQIKQFNTTKTDNNNQNLSCTGSNNKTCNITNGQGIKYRTCNNGNWTAYGACTIQSCNNGYDNCDGSNTNGCETNLQTSTNNCGTCGHTCTALQTCTQGTCITTDTGSDDTTTNACTSAGYNCGTLNGASCGTCPTGLTCSPENLCISTTGHTYYVATPANGGSDTTGDGTKTKPWATWQKAFDTVQAGDIAYIRGGTYYPTREDNYGVYIYNKKGTADKPITISAYPGEKPIMDCYTDTNSIYNGIYLVECDYWNLDGLTVSNAMQPKDGSDTGVGFNLKSCLRMRLNNCNSKNNQGPGFQFYYGTGSNITAINCDSYNNFDPYTTYPNGEGGNADGFVTYANDKNSITNFIGCRAWNNSDDGFDTYGTDGLVKFYSCWSFSNGYGDAGNGMGFKLGITYEPTPPDYRRILRNCIAADNLATGFDGNAVNAKCQVYNNFAYSNNNGWSFSGGNPNLAHIFINNLDYDNDAIGGFCSLAIHNHNSWDSDVIVTDSDFESLDTSQLSKPRKANGSLPDITFGHLVQGSDLIDKGTEIGLPYSGSAPDIGIFEYVGVTTPLPTINTYYISNSGSDSSTRDGSINSPWKTLSYACSRVTTSGSVIHVNAGTYIETSQCTLAVGVSIEGEGDRLSIIKSTINNAPTISLSSSSIINGNQHISGIKLDGSNLAGYIAVLVNQRSNVQIHDCTFVDFKESGVGFYGNYIEGQETNTFCINNLFYNNKIINCASFLETGSPADLEVWNQQGMKIYNNLINQTARGPRADGFGFRSYGNKDVKIYNNTIIVDYEDESLEYNSWVFAMEFWDSMGGIEIYDNRIQGVIDLAGYYGRKGTYSYSYSLHNNIIGHDYLKPGRHGIYLESFQDLSDVVIYQNMFQNLKTAIYLFTASSSSTFSDITFSYNIFNNIGMTSPGWHGGIFSEGGASGYKVNNLNFLNNVFISADYSWTSIELPSKGTVNNVDIRNNIIVGFDDSVIRTGEDGGGNINDLSIENNIFYGNKNNNQPILSGITSSSYTYQNNKEGVDPKFISSTNFHLQSDSPAINAGLTIPGLTKDYDGNTVPYGSAPDIGAFEYR